MSPNLKASVNLQAALGIEHQFGELAATSVTYVDSRGVHQYLSENVNAFLPGTYDAATGSGSGPDGINGNIYRSRSRFLLGGNLQGPYGVSFSPVLVTNSGTPFNVTIGQDLNGDDQYNDRPAFATGTHRCSSEQIRSVRSEPVSELDLKTLEVTGHIDVGGEPYGLAWAVQQ